MTRPDNDHVQRLCTRRSPRPPEAAQLLAVKPSWIYEAVRAGTLPCMRIGRHIRFTRTMLEDWLQGRGGVKGDSPWC
jgi:excisionase family DNA binding protein